MRIRLSTDGVGLRKLAGVSSECMNRVYDTLRELDIGHLKRMWAEADKGTPADMLLRHQIAFTIERKLNGRWK